MPLDEENEEVEQKVPEKKTKGSLVKVILVVLSIVLLVVGSVAATLYFAGVIPAGDEATVEESSDEGDDGKEKKKKKGKVSDVKEPPIYLTFEHPFVVNFIDKNQIRYLQINVEVMARDQAVIDGIEAHMPKIKNNLLIIFSDLDFEMITSATGKQRLRDLALEEVRRIVKQETGKSGLEALYFTGFVMQ